MRQAELGPWKPLDPDDEDVRFRHPAARSVSIRTFDTTFYSTELRLVRAGPAASPEVVTHGIYSTIRVGPVVLASLGILLVLVLLYVPYRWAVHCVRGPKRLTPIPCDDSASLTR